MLAEPVVHSGLPRCRTLPWEFAGRGVWKTRPESGCGHGADAVSHQTLRNRQPTGIVQVTPVPFSQPLHEMFPSRSEQAGELCKIPESGAIPGSD